MSFLLSPRRAPISTSLLLLVPLLGLAFWACTTQEVQGGGNGDGCTSDSQCDSDEICDDGDCVPFDDTSGGPGSTTSTGSGFTPQAKDLCQNYLDCLAVAYPEEVANAMTAYGPSGTCWDSGPETAETCATACEQAMKSLHDNAPEVCFECYEDADCSSSSATCEAGACAFDLAVPTTSPDCSACAADVLAGDCSYYAEQCTNDTACVKAAACAGSCGEDLECLQNCTDIFGSIYGELLNCVCYSGCSEVCSNYWCGMGG